MNILLVFHPQNPVFVWVYPQKGTSQLKHPQPSKKGFYSPIYEIKPILNHVPEIFIFQNLILRTRLCGTGFMTQPSWFLDFRLTESVRLKSFVLVVYQFWKDISAGPALKYFTWFIGAGGCELYFNKSGSDTLIRDFNVAYSSRWGYSLINTLKLKKKLNKKTHLVSNSSLSPYHSWADACSHSRVFIVRFPAVVLWFFLPSCWVSTQWLSSTKWIPRGGRHFRCAFLCIALKVLAKNSGVDWVKMYGSRVSKVEERSQDRYSEMDVCT